MHTQKRVLHMHLAKEGQWGPAIESGSPWPPPGPPLAVPLGNCHKSEAELWFSSWTSDLTEPKKSPHKHTNSHICRHLCIPHAYVLYMQSWVLVDKAGWTPSDLHLHGLWDYKKKERAKGQRTLPSQKHSLIPSHHFGLLHTVQD